MESTVAAKKPAIDRRDLPYYEKTLECPVCGIETVHRRLKEGTFMVEERDEDQYIKKFRWFKPAYEKYHFYFFKFWYCPHCHFADEYIAFYGNVAKQTGRNFSTLIKFFREKAPQDSFIRKISEYMVYPVTTLQQSVLLHLLVLYIQLMPGETRRDYEKITRFSLRTAWMFRIAFQNQEDLPSVRSYEITTDEFFANHERLQTGTINLLMDLETMGQLVSEDSDQCQALRSFPSWSDYRYTLDQIYRQSMQAMDTLISNIQHYEKVGRDLKSRIHKDDGNPLNLPYQNFSSFFDVLEVLKEHWPQLPDSEPAAIRISIKAIKAILKSGILDDQQIKLFRIYDLMITLYQKIDDYRSANDYANILHKQAYGFKTELSRQLENLRVVTDRRKSPKKLSYFLKRTEQILVRNRWRREKIQKVLNKEQEELASSLFHQNRDLHAAELIRLMEEHHIPQAIIDRYVRISGEEKKKGIFQIFKL